MLKGKRYAPIFTSRGCPYLCNYCHDLFGKRFIHRSSEHVLEEIELLYENYGVDEFEIVDDIFNLHKPRLKKIMGEVKRRWPGKIHFCFPNGVRADIMDEEVIEESILVSDIFTPRSPVYAGDPDAVDAAIAAARKSGKRAVRLSEGAREPDSIFVFDKNSLRGK